MNLFHFAVIVLISIAAIIILLSNVAGILEESKDVEKYSQGLFLMKSIDKVIKELITEEGGAKRIVTNNAGLVIASDSDNTIKFSLDISEDFLDAGDYKEESVKIIARKGRIELLLNYTGFVDIIGNVSTTQNLFIEKINDTAIRIDKR